MRFLFLLTSEKAINFVTDKSKKAADAAGKIIDDIYELLSKGKQALSEFFEAIWKKIVDWFLKNKKALNELTQDAKDVLKYGKDMMQRIAIRYAKAYPEGQVYNILKVRQAFSLYGKVGRNLVIEVDKVFENIIKTAKSIKEYKLKVMVSGMIYNGKKTSKVFTAVNFTREEIELGKVAEFIENMHPVLKARYELHLKQTLNASKELIDKAGIAASHGE